MPFAEELAEEDREAARGVEPELEEPESWPTRWEAGESSARWCVSSADFGTPRGGAAGLASAHFAITARRPRALHNFAKSVLVTMPRNPWSLPTTQRYCNPMDLK
mmetsp:Transcript_17597/g.50205  ORF Transcript_17597/g.50205 Transcript_17597/m.50205 type:complete len:105 (-) Transcript_17597:91-405(-)